MAEIWGETKAQGPRAMRELKALDKAMASIAAQEIALLRRKHKLSQRQLGALAKVQPAEVSRIEQGKTNPRIRTVAKLANALGADVRLVPRASARVARVRRPPRTAHPRK